MTKYSGTSNEPITWKGSLGVLAGSTPSIYTHFEEVADMGERFIYYRMKNYDIEKATRISLDRKIFGKELDEKLSDIYAEYVKDSIKNVKDMPDVSPEVHERIINIAMFAALLRTPTHYDRYAKVIDKLPISEMPMRVALQLLAVAKGLMVMSYYDHESWELSEKDIGYIEWCAYSLANEERRACLRILSSIPEYEYISGQAIADQIGLNTTVINMNLQHLSAIGVVDRFGDGTSLKWRMKNIDYWNIVRRLEEIEEVVPIQERLITNEEDSELDLDKF